MWLEPMKALQAGVRREICAENARPSAKPSPSFEPLQMTSIAERRHRNASPGDRRAIPIASPSLSDFGLVVQNHVQQRIMHFQCPIVFDEAQFPELVHEEA